MAWLASDSSVVLQMFFVCSFHSTFNRIRVRVPIRIGHVRSVQFIVWAGAYRALIDITQEYLSNLFPIHYQQMVICPAASNKSISESEVNITRADLIDISNDVVHGPMVQLQAPVTNPFIAGLSAC